MDAEPFFRRGFFFMTGLATDTPRLIGVGAVLTMLGISRSALYTMMRNGAFPKPRRLGSKTIRWPVEEVEQWLRGLPRAEGDLG